MTPTDTPATSATARPAFLGDAHDGDLITFTDPRTGDSVTGVIYAMRRGVNAEIGRSIAIEFRLDCDRSFSPDRVMSASAHITITPKMGGTKMSKSTNKSVSTDAPVVDEKSATTDAPVVDEKSATTDAPVVDATPSGVPSGESIIAAYRSGDAKTKANIRRDVDKMIKSAIRSGDMPGAQRAMAIQDQLVTVRAVAAVDYADVIARRVASLAIASEMIKSGVVTPDGMPDDFVINADDIAARVKSIMAEITADSTCDTARTIGESATKIASTKITKSVDRHDTGEYIMRALSTVKINQPVSVAQIIHLGAIDGDDYRPTSGAVTARLKSKNTIDGVTACDARSGDRIVFGAMRTIDFPAS